MVDEAEQAPNEHFRNAGYCHCCRSNTEFVAYSAWLRDSYVCGQCMSCPRQRHIQLILDTYFPGWENKKIHESSPSNSFISRYCKEYSSSQYMSGMKSGTITNGIRAESIEQLSFDDNSIDIFITQDVLEHVFHPEIAIKEISRVLKPGGFHLFTTPKYKTLGKSTTRAKIMPDGTLTHLLPAEYHGNPVGDGRALVTFDFGNDFEDLLSEWSGKSVQVFHTKDRSKGIDAEFNEVFIIRA
ncbi:class I SAM-dependent methyltransferase [Pseudomonas reactans]